ncbi:uncharacterized protein G2W53_041233 [Senna tora]|uniref:Uncharacterized protein n=1 Tax=Senna tora TaxID=362788 RepID=A0A834SF32_9FABA|nr:uncharacterized protein G2W53_041233 [Senna tora]
MTTPIRASNPPSLANTTCTDRFHIMRNKTFDSNFLNVSELRPQFLIRNMLRQDP